MSQFIVQWYEGDEWTTVDDVVNGSISVDYGFSGKPLIETLASTGTAEFEVADYGGGNIVDNYYQYFKRPVRIINYIEEEYIPVFLGYIKSASMENRDDMYIVRFHCVDFLDRMAQEAVRNVIPIRYVTVQQALNRLLEQINDGLIMLDCPSDIGSKILETWMDVTRQGATIYEEVASILRSIQAIGYVTYDFEQAYLVVKDYRSYSPSAPVGKFPLPKLQSEYITTEDGETLDTEEPAHAVVANQTTDAVLVYYTMRHHTNRLRFNDVINRVITRYRERTYSNTLVQLYSAQPFTMLPGQIVSLTCNYSTEDGNTVYAYGVVTPTGGADIIANTLPDGTGADMTASIIVADFRAYNSYAEITLYNSASVAVTVTRLTLRGYAINMTGEYINDYADPTSIRINGESSVTLEMPYNRISGEIIAGNILANNTVARAYADTVDLWETPEVRSAHNIIFAKPMTILTTLTTQTNYVRRNKLSCNPAGYMYATLEMDNRGPNIVYAYYEPGTTAVFTAPPIMNPEKKFNISFTVLGVSSSTFSFVPFEIISGDLKIRIIITNNSLSLQIEAIEENILSIYTATASITWSSVQTMYIIYDNGTTQIFRGTLPITVTNSYSSVAATSQTTGSAKLFIRQTNLFETTVFILRNSTDTTNGKLLFFGPFSFVEYPKYGYDFNQDGLIAFDKTTGQMALVRR